MLRYIVIFLLCFFSLPPAQAQNGALYFQGIPDDIASLMSIQTGINARPLWEACAKHEMSACDRLSSFPLSSKGSGLLRQLRYAAVQRKSFQTQWDNCFTAGIVQACQAALQYPSLSSNDRESIIGRINTIRTEAQESARKEELRIQQEREAEFTRRQKIEQARQIAAEREAAALRLKIEAEKLEKERVLHEQKLAAALSECKQKIVGSCSFGIQNARNGEERSEFVYLLNVSQSPLGIIALRPLNDLPWEKISLVTLVLFSFALIWLVALKRQFLTRKIKAIVSSLHALIVLAWQKQQSLNHGATYESPLFIFSQSKLSADRDTEFKKNLSDKWLLRFSYFEKLNEVNFSNYYKLLKSMTFQQRLEILSFWGVLFGIFYYFYLGLWRKALSIIGAWLAGVALLTVVDSHIETNIDIAFRVWFCVPSVFSMCYLPVDYYKKERLSDKSWMPFPFNEPKNNFFRKYSGELYGSLVVLILGVGAVWYASGNSLSLEASKMRCFHDSDMPCISFLNKGDKDIRVTKLVINSRAEKKCTLNVDKVLRTGGSFAFNYNPSEGFEGVDRDKLNAEDKKVNDAISAMSSLLGPACGEVVRLNVYTDRGVATFSW